MLTFHIPVNVRGPAREAVVNVTVCERRVIFLAASKLRALVQGPAVFLPLSEKRTDVLKDDPGHVIGSRLIDADTAVEARQKPKAPVGFFAPAGPGDAA